MFPGGLTPTAHGELTFGEVGGAGAGREHQIGLIDVRGVVHVAGTGALGQPYVREVARF